MPIEYELKIIKEITEEAMQKYCQEVYSTSWFFGIEKLILKSVMENDKNILNFFFPNELNAMKDLVRRGYWLINDGRFVLSRKPLEEYEYEKILDTVKNGAD